jgi:hypothetical protein
MLSRASDSKYISRLYNWYPEDILPNSKPSCDITGLKGIKSATKGELFDEMRTRKLPREQCIFV